MTEPRVAPPLSDHPLDVARAILLQEDRERFTQLQTVVEQQAMSAETVGQILPSAVRVATAQGTALGEAMGPSITDALQKSIRENPQEVVDAISPIMVPAIRRAIALAIQGMVQSLNRTIEQSLSAQSLRWRWEAWSAGRSFGEIVLLHTLAYRVEQVFLIHRASGLLLHHAHARDTVAADPDIVSGMLTAIQSFVQDSLGGSQEDTLHLSGIATEEWLRYTRTAGPLIPGIDAVDFSRCRNGDREELAAVVASLESVSLFFQPGSQDLEEGQAQVLDNVAQLAQRVLRLARRQRLEVEIQVVGFSFPSDSLDNDKILQLRRARAEQAVEALVIRGIPRPVVQRTEAPIAEGESPPSVAEPSEDVVRRERRVQLHVRTW